jgi:Transcription factor WhiB
VSVAYSLDGAVCEGLATVNYDPFFPESREAEADALAFCSICPVRGACLAFPVDTGQMFGIWGGTTQREVRSLIARARAGRARSGRMRPSHTHGGKTHCANGHPFDALNTYYTPTGERRCRACRARIARARRRAGRVTGGER